jgi:hypothetical protein
MFSGYSRISSGGVLCRGSRFIRSTMVIRTWKNRNSMYDRLRSHLPLRGSAGFSPDSLFRADRSLRRSSAQPVTSRQLAEPLEMSTDEWGVDTVGRPSGQSEPLEPQVLDPRLHARSHDRPRAMTRSARSAPACATSRWLRPRSSSLHQAPTRSSSWAALSPPGGEVPYQSSAQDRRRSGTCSLLSKIGQT